MFRRNLARKAALALVLCGLAALPAASLAQGAPPADALSDPSFKGSEVIAFAGLKSGDKIADVVAGRFVRVFSKAVGPTGHVYAVVPAEVVKLHPQALDMLKAVASLPDYANVTVSTPAINTPELPTGLDAVFIRQNYHDLHDPFMGPADVPAFNRHVFEALKKGGVYVVLDHADAAGSGLAGTNTRHRIDPETVKAEVLAAGFVLEAESKILANPADDHTKNVFDPSIRGKTDQFLFKFRKP
jgi:predicted methyltransferase